jgi:crotonobetainyl-CoA:carnitine CoA-transferase CaiB-like acyl-CoA transferase
VTPPPESSRELPLQGIRVLELGHIVAGPSAGLILADLGADVCKVEDPRTGDTARNQANQGTTFFSFNRNKHSIAIDLRSAGGKDVFARLVRRSDVVLDNYSSGALERLGVGYDWGSRINPRIIYCSIKGFLQGPHASRPYLDELAQMEGGLAFVTGLPGRPMRAAASIVDIGAATYGIVGVLAALYRRESSGVGADIRSGLFETTVFWMNQYFARVQLGGETPRPRDPNAASAFGGAMGWGVYQLFETCDEQQLFIAATTNRHWTRLCQLLGLSDLADDVTLNTNAKRASNRAVIIPRIAEAVRQLDMATLVRILHEAEVPYAPVNTPVDLVDERHLNEGDHLVTVTLSDGRSFKQPALPVMVDKDRPPVRLPPPSLGEHTDQILAELGYKESEIEHLKATNAVLQSDRMLAIDT